MWASSTILSDGVTEVLGESMSDLRTARDRALRLYDATAARTSAGVLAAYSTSFGLGTRLLGRRAQEDIRAVYALVRLADEVVDTYRGEDAGAELDELEEQTARALRTGYSTNLVVHAFARTARRVGISAAETEPFFASMRADLTVREHDRASYEAYVYGSAEVVGLMCVRAFLNEDRRPGEPVREPDQAQVAGARALGAAFQKINFLRDLGADTEELGRTYFPGTTPGHLDDAQLQRDPARRSPTTWRRRGRRCRACRGGRATRSAPPSRSTSGCSTRSRRGRRRSCWWAGCGCPRR